MVIFAIKLILFSVKFIYFTSRTSIQPPPTQKFNAVKVENGIIYIQFNQDLPHSTRLPVGFAIQDTHLNLCIDAGYPTPKRFRDQQQQLRDRAHLRHHQPLQQTYLLKLQYTSQQNGSHIRWHPIYWINREYSSNYVFATIVVSTPWSVTLKLIFIQIILAVSGQPKSLWKATGARHAWNFGSTQRYWHDYAVRATWIMSCCAPGSLFISLGTHLIYYISLFIQKNQFCCFQQFLLIVKTSCTS
ncbi:hypothetical protein SS50377_26247 [Spironucleus salmonicida]|uniref:Uncharacterized protein n=1 Tax=Spironucleus salmonicida TaxID=348837 RepID=A0A9P8RWT9_9EUKA|nr:hypothetical protein SS50377_26247 [Spironucleus salmonicida]